MAVTWQRWMLSSGRKVPSGKPLIQSSATAWLIKPSAQWPDTSEKPALPVERLPKHLHTAVTNSARVTALLGRKVPSS